MNAPYYADEDVTLFLGDCLDVLRALPADSVDAIVTDPPAGVAFMSRTWDTYGSRARFVEWLTERMAAALRVLKPGGHALVWSLPRTSHWTAWAVEDAGFEVRDCVLHLFGSGFPKSLDVSKAIDRARDDSAPARAVGAWLRQQRVASGLSAKAVAEHFRTAPERVNHGGCVANWESDSVPTWDQWLRLREVIGFGDEMDAEVWRLNGRKGTPGEAWEQREVVSSGKSGAAAVAYVRDVAGEYDITAPATEDARRWAGFGTSLKPGQEMWWLARKPLEGTVAASVLRWGTGALNVDACRVAHVNGENPSAARRASTPPEREAGSWANDRRSPETYAAERPGEAEGRWPANVVLTHSASDDPHGECVSYSDGADCARLLSSVLGSLESCPSCLRFCDGQAHRVLEAARELPQLQRGASVAGCSSLAKTLGRIQRNLQTPPPRPDAAGLCAMPESMPVSRIAPGHRRAGEPGTAAGIAHTGSPELQHSDPRGSTPASSTALLSGSCGRADHSACRAEAVGRLLDLASVTIIRESCPVGELDRQSGVTTSTGGKGVKSAQTKSGLVYGDYAESASWANAGGLGDVGGASRFYPVFKYQAKAPASERPRLDDGTAHETVKPLSLLIWMIKLICPPGGTVLDMFCGSGVTGEAAIVEGFRCILIDQDPKSADLTVKRLSKPIQPVMFGLDAS